MSDNSSVRRSKACSRTNHNQSLAVGQHCARQHCHSFVRLITSRTVKFTILMYSSLLLVDHVILYFTLPQVDQKLYFTLATFCEIGYTALCADQGYFSPTLHCNMSHYSVIHQTAIHFSISIIRIHFLEVHRPCVFLSLCLVVIHSCNHKASSLHLQMRNDGRPFSLCCTSLC